MVSAEGGPLAEGEAGGGGGGHIATLAEGGVAGHGDGEDGGLADVGAGEGFGGAFEAELLEVKAEDVVGLVEEGHDFGIGLGEVFAHSGELGALSCEEEVQHVYCFLSWPYSLAVFGFPRRFQPGADRDGR